VSDRVLRLQGLLNLRDLGGLPTLDGRRVRRGVLFRSDYPALVGDSEVSRAVTRLGLRAVVDLRARREAEFECVAWSDYGVDYHQCPISSGGSSWHAGYHLYLTHRPETVASALRVLLQPGLGPALFHCAAGKDRTGTVAALLLSALGVADTEVVADYVLSAGSVAGVLARLEGAAPYLKVLEGETAHTQRPRGESMQAFLDWLSVAGGAQAWLLDHGIERAVLEEAQAGLLEGP
jgi:protein-tyrosine phosphatase